MGRISLTAAERAKLKASDILVTDWGKGGQPAGQEKQRWYDRYGREFILPAMPDMDKFRRGRGLSLTPPSNPETLVVVDPTEAIIAGMEEVGGSEAYLAAIPDEEPPEPEQPSPTIQPRTYSWDIE